MKGRLNFDTKLSRDFKPADMLKPSSMRTRKFERAFKVAQYGFHVISARVDNHYSKCKNLLLITLTPFKSN